MKTTLLARAAAIALLLSAPALAHASDGSVARLVAVSGSVLVSASQHIASAAESTRLVAGSRVLTTANASAVVEYDNGCRVSIGRAERFVVGSGSACLQAAQGATPLRIATAPRS